MKAWQDEQIESDTAINIIRQTPTPHTWRGIVIIFYRIPNQSPNMLKISIMLNETGLPYVEKIISNDEDSAKLTEISPNGTTPAIIDTDTGATLFESGAILLYLAEKSGKLIPSDSRSRADVFKWLMFESSNVCPTMIELHHYILNDAGQFPDSLIDRYKQRLESYCAILNQRLKDSSCLAGEYSIADIILYPWTVTLGDIAEIDITEYPHLNNWATTISEHLKTMEATQAFPDQRNWCYNNKQFSFCSA